MRGWGPATQRSPQKTACPPPHKSVTTLSEKTKPSTPAASCRRKTMVRHTENCGCGKDESPSADCHSRGSNAVFVNTVRLVLQGCEEHDGEGLWALTPCSSNALYSTDPYPPAVSPCTEMQPPLGWNRAKDWDIVMFWSCRQVQRQQGCHRCSGNMPLSGKVWQSLCSLQAL